ncbi:MAG: hypothetical protein KGL46_08270 [Hyphomicrobiales bacterium]|nr:hypothetical protein [Hyphomicrobiales bacterium]
MPRLAAPFLASLLLVAGLRHSAQAQTFVIGGAEGYGVTDCLVDGQKCGKIVADAWCEGHGFSAARAFGKAEDLTASIDAGALKASPGSVVIACAP